MDKEDIDISSESHPKLIASSKLLCRKCQQLDEPLKCVDCIDQFCRTCITNWCKEVAMASCN